MRKLPNGVSNYEKIVKENMIYVDKTMYIEKMENLSDSTSWGNYYNTLWNITNADSKYYTNSQWTSGACGTKTSDSSIILSTGASDTFCKQGIYDLAGNVYEWTLENTSLSSSPCVGRGGNYGSNGSGYPAAYRDNDNTTSYYGVIGFRASLF